MSLAKVVPQGASLPPDCVYQDVFYGEGLDFLRRLELKKDIGEVEVPELRVLKIQSQFCCKST